MKAIQTRYKGYHFRSRLEARWAVFFDALGLQWEYEPEGFDLGDAGWYLPDFYLPQLNAWVEIKPSSGDMDEVRKQLTSMIELKIAEMGKAWGLFGDPLSAWWMLPIFYDGSGLGKWHEFPGWYDEWPSAGIQFEFDESKGAFYAHPGFRLGQHIPEGWSDLPPDELYGNYREKVKARSARFEHGETPL